MTINYLIKLLNDKYHNNVSFQSSEQTQYQVYFESIKDVVPVFDELYEYHKLELINGLSLHIDNDKLKLMFSVNLGYKDVISKK